VRERERGSWDSAKLENSVWPWGLEEIGIEDRFLGLGNARKLGRVRIIMRFFMVHGFRRNWKNEGDGTWKNYGRRHLFDRGRIPKSFLYLSLFHSNFSGFRNRNPSINVFQFQDQDWFQNPPSLSPSHTLIHTPTLPVWQPLIVSELIDISSNENIIS